MTEPVKHTLFICYSHTDQKYREQFSKFLGGNPVPDMEISTFSGLSRMK